MMGVMWHGTRDERIPYQWEATPASPTVIDSLGLASRSSVLKAIAPIVRTGTIADLH
jgi:hypothetical protein